MSVNESEHDDTERFLQLGMLVQLIEDNVGIGIAAKLDDDTHPFAVAFVSKVGDAFYHFIANEFGDLFDKACFVDLIRDLCNDDAVFAVGHLFDVAFGTHLDRTAACHICLMDAVAAEDHGTRREIGTLKLRHELGDRDIGIVNFHDDRIDDLTHVVRRNIRCHTDCDTRRAVDEKARDLRREDARFGERFVIVRYEGNGIFLNIGKHCFCYARHTDFCITHCCRAVTVDRTEVAVTVYEHIARREVLCQADGSIVYRSVTVRMVLTEYFPDDTRRFFVRLVRCHACFMHRVQDAAMYRF